MNQSYDVVRDKGGTHEQGLVAELTNLAGALSFFPPPLEDVVVVRERLVALATLIRQRPPVPTPERVQDACRLLRSTVQAPRGLATAVRSALRLLEG